MKTAILPWFIEERWANLIVIMAYPIVTRICTEHILNPPWASAATAMIGCLTQIWANQIKLIQSQRNCLITVGWEVASFPANTITDELIARECDPQSSDLRLQLLIVETRYNTKFYHQQ